jgi:hypothetical protein
MFRLSSIPIDLHPEPQTPNLGTLTSWRYLSELAKEDVGEGETRYVVFNYW